MAGEARPTDQFEHSRDAVRDGGASTDRGGRDAGTAGPAPNDADEPGSGASASESTMSGVSRTGKSPGSRGDDRGGPAGAGA